LSTGSKQLRLVWTSFVSVMHTKIYCSIVLTLRWPEVCF